MDFINLHCVLFYCHGGCGLSVLCNKEYDDDDDDDDDDNIEDSDSSETWRDDSWDEYHQLITYQDLRTAFPLRGV